MVISEYSLGPTCSNGVRDVDELPLELEAVGEPLGQRLDAELLGCVVAGGDEGDLQLARERLARLRRLAGQVEVVALGGGLWEVLGASARDDRDAAQLGRAV